MENIRIRYIKKENVQEYSHMDTDLIPDEVTIKLLIQTLFVSNIYVNHDKRKYFFLPHEDVLFSQFPSGSPYRSNMYLPLLALLRGSSNQYTAVLWFL